MGAPSRLYKWLFFAALFGFDLFGQFLALAGLIPLVHDGLGDLVSR